MTIRFGAKVLSRVANDGGVYYSDCYSNADLGTGERYYVEAKCSNVATTPTTLSVTLETSNDNVNWTVRSTPIVPTPVFEGTVLTGFELGTNVVGGRYARFGIQLGGASPGAYVELWVVAREALPSTALDLSSGGTFSRALSAFYYTGAPTDGVRAFMVAAASGVRRVEDRGDGLGRCLLMEKSATNLVKQNRDPTQTSAWQVGTSTPTAGDENGPDGSATGTRIQIAAGGYSPYQAITTSNLEVTGSIWHKRKRGIGVGNSQCSLPNNSVTVGTGASISKTLSETWQRDSASTNVGGGGTVQELEGRAGTGFTAQALDNNVDLVQVEFGYYPTSPIPTTTAAVTRPADTLSYANGAYPVGFLTSGVVIDFAPDAADSEIVSANEEWRLLQVGSSDYVRIRNSSGSCKIELMCGGTSFGRTVTFSRGQRLLITAKPSAGTITISGATTGNGTATGTGAAWASGATLYIGGSNAGTNNATGRYVGAIITQAP